MGNGAPDKSSVRCRSAMRRFNKKSMWLRRKVVIYGTPYVARKSGVNAIRAGMTNEIKSRTGARLFSDPNRLNGTRISSLCRATPSLVPRVDIPSSPWLRKEAVLQRYATSIARLPNNAASLLLTASNLWHLGFRQWHSIMTRGFHSIN